MQKKIMASMLVTTLLCGTLTGCGSQAEVEAEVSETGIEVVETEDTSSSENTTIEEEAVPDVDGEFCNDNGYIGNAVQVDEKVASTVRYTTIRTNTEELKTLVKNTITKYSEAIEKGKESEIDGERFEAALFLLEDAYLNDIDLTTTFKSIDGSASPVDVYEGDGTSTPTTLSYINVAGSIGTDLYLGGDVNADEDIDFIPGNYREDTLYCAYFVANKGYDIDIDLIKDWDITSNLGNTTFNATGLDGDDADLYDINFIVKFSVDDIDWTANIGNYNNAYKVLDIYRDDSIDSGAKANVQTSNTPEVWNQDNNETNPDATLTTGDSTDDYVPSANVDSDGIDHGPEGDKEGYTYVPGLGYVSYDDSGEFKSQGSEGEESGVKIGNMN